MLALQWIKPNPIQFFVNPQRLTTSDKNNLINKINRDRFYSDYFCICRFKVIRLEVLYRHLKGTGCFDQGKGIVENVLRLVDGFSQWIFVSLGFGYNAYGISALFKPIALELGFNRANTSIAAGIGRFQGGFEAPIAGWITDRYGPKWIVFIGILLSRSVCC